MAVVRILVGAALMFAVVQGGAIALGTKFDATVIALALMTAMLVVGFVIERVAFARGPRAAVLALGFGAARPSALVAATILSIAMLAYFPVYAAITGAPVHLKRDFLWVLVSAIAVNGIAEEALFRGFVFGHLRQAGHSFARSALVSLAIFGAVHLLLFTSTPPIVAIMSTVLALIAAVPFAFLYERSGQTIWAGVILHVTGHAIRLVDVPDARMTSILLPWIVVQVAASFGVFAFSRTLLR